MRHISLHIHDNTSQGLQRECSLYFVPRRSVSCKQILKEEKVHDLLTIGEYPLYMVPLDEDVLSFDLDLAYKECLVDADTTSLWHIREAIHKLEAYSYIRPGERLGCILFSYACNFLASTPSGVGGLTRSQTEEPVNTSDVFPEISTLILLDREVDMVTPMCTLHS